MLLAGLTGCSSVNPYFDPSKPHHRRDGFQNTTPVDMPPGGMAFLRWQWDAWRHGLPPRPQQATLTQAPDLAFITRNAIAGAAMVPSATWLGHASVLVQAGGLNILTDPMLSERASPLSFVGPRRVQPPGLSLRQLPHIDAVLISHNHYDHLDEDSVVALNAQVGGPPMFIVPLGLKPWLAQRGIYNTVELDWWQSRTLAGTEVMLTPVQHWSGRGLHDRFDTLWGGFAVLSPGFHWFFAGDTGYSNDFAQIRQRLADRQRDGGFDLALIPIGAYEPRWFMASQHVNPDESLRIHRDLGARRSLGVHWGTFNLTDEPLDQAPRDLAQARRANGLDEDAFFVLAVGQTRRLPPRPVARSAASGRQAGGLTKVAQPAR